LILRKRPVFLLLFIFLASVLNLGADETKDSYIRMLIKDRTGRYSLYFLTDPENMKYKPLFYSNANTSFLDINVNGTSYRLGSSGVFKTRVDRENTEPVVIYESSFLTVKEIFTPVKTLSSLTANGIRITIQIQNKSENDLSVGLRMLLDANLGEGRKNIPFITENHNIIKEKIIEGSSEERYWISRGKDVSLMGSIADPLDENARKPDYLHFANWKKLSDVPWKASYHEGRSFNKLPYSVGDSAVCYYWEPRSLERGGTFTYTVYLTTEDITWYYPELYVEPVRPAPVEPVVEIPEIVVEPEEIFDQSAYNLAFIEDQARKLSLLTNEDYNVIVLRMLKDILNQFIAGEISLNELDLLQIDLAIERHGSRQE
jgi:hypothetical protein